MIEQFGNIFRIPELRKKVLITLGLIALCRVGVYIPIPGIDTMVLKTYFQQFTQSGVGQLLGLVDMFAGGALTSGAIFGLRGNALHQCIHHLPIASRCGSLLRKVAKGG